jgi:protein phosphatase
VLPVSPGVARQLTNDHSWLNEQVQAGLLTEEEAAMSDLKHIITRSVGFEREVQADLLAVNVSPGDAFLLCSDGLCNYIDLEEFAHLARQHFYSDLPRVCLDIALERGGEDNVTCVVIGASKDRTAGAGPVRCARPSPIPCRHWMAEDGQGRHARP